MTDSPVHLDAKAPQIRWLHQLYLDCRLLIVDCHIITCAFTAVNISVQAEDNRPELSIQIQ